MAIKVGIQMMLINASGCDKEIGLKNGLVGTVLEIGINGTTVYVEFSNGLKVFVSISRCVFVGDCDKSGKKAVLVKNKGTAKVQVYLFHTSRTNRAVYHTYSGLKEIKSAF